MSTRFLTHPGNILLPVAVLACALGMWQLQRMDEKTALIDQFENAEHQGLDSALQSDDRFVRVHARGIFDPERHILLDNKIFKGRAGVQVLTPFFTETGNTILVNRGWQPIAPDRSSLPEFETPENMTEIQGILAPPPENRQTLGAPDVLSSDNWPQLVTYLEIQPVAEILETTLPERVLWLDASHDAGFEGREWSPSTMTPQHHKAYAVQWFALALAAFVFWCVLMWRMRGKNA